MLLFVVFAWCVAVTVPAQISEGVIHYERTIDVHRNIPPEREEWKAMIPQFREETFELFFTPSESLYKPAEDVEADMGGRRGGGMRMMRSPRTETYIDRDNREVTIQQDFMGRNYLITEELDIAPWRIGHQQTEILGYVCMMAWYNDTVMEQEITAWFTPHIQPFLGPDRFVTLPGTVLAVDINNGEQVWVARKIEERKLESREVRKPTRGEPISREAFNEMLMEQRERMAPGGGRRPGL